MAQSDFYRVFDTVYVCRFDKAARRKQEAADVEAGISGAEEAAGRRRAAPPAPGREAEQIEVVTRASNADPYHDTYVFFQNVLNKKI